MLLVRDFLKFVALLLGRIASRSAILSRGYIWFLSLINRLTGFEYQSFLVNSLKRERWPSVIMQRPYQVQLPGLYGQFLYLYPHQGEFDFEAVLGGVLRYESRVFSELNGILGSHDFIFEVGANVGVFSVWMESRLRACSRLRGMFVCEPSIEACSRLIKNSAANDCRRLSILNLAISDRPGTMSFFEPEGHLTNGSFSYDFARVFSEVIRETLVPVTTIDVLAAAVPDNAAVLLKIDAEGHEASVIRGCANLFGRVSVDLIIEILDGDESESDVYGALQLVCEFEKVARLGERDWLFRCRPARQQKPMQIVQ